VASVARLAGVEDALPAAAKPVVEKPAVVTDEAAASDETPPAA
jgi:hypothetical protein